MPEMTDQDLTELKGLMEKAKADESKPYGIGWPSHPKDGVPYEEEWWASSKSDAAYALLRHAPALIRAKEREKMYRKALEQIAEGNLPCVSGPDDYCHDLMKYARSALSAFDAQSEAT